MRILFYLLFIIFFTVTCKQKTTEESQPDTPTLSADFEAFYKKFHDDSSFQMQSILFPLEGRPSMKVGMDSIPSDFRWQIKDWVIHKPYDDMNGTFSRSFLQFNDIVTEEIVDESGHFTMVRRFSKMSDGWKLIYYKEMGL
jgi:hypothetical protein